jgi:uncharacterized caspase-like protein
LPKVYTEIIVSILDYKKYSSGKNVAMKSVTSVRKNAHAAVIGINKYEDSRIPDLTFARADAEGVYQVLVDPELGRFSPENVTLLLDEKATQRNIRTEIGNALRRRAGKDDLVYIYYAGHGSGEIAIESSYQDGIQKYLVPFDAELDNLFSTGIAMDEIQKFFGRIESKQVIFFIDSCYSGEAGGRTFQNPHYQTRAGLTSEFLDSLAGEGRLVVTACDVNEVSLETPEMRHGLFTYHLIEGLKGAADKDGDRLVTLQELYEYVYDKVSEHARKMGGKMHPIQKGSIRGKIFLTQYETAEDKKAREIHSKAQSCCEESNYDEAYKCWQEILELVPDHEGARQGIERIENIWQEENRKKQQVIREKKRILQELLMKKKLPPPEYERGMRLIGKDIDKLNESEHKIKELLEPLLSGEISVRVYLESLQLLEKPSKPIKSEISVEPEPPTAVTDDEKIPPSLEEPEIPPDTGTPILKWLFVAMAGVIVLLVLLIVFQLSKDVEYEGTVVIEEAHKDIVKSLASSSDGRYIASGGEDGTIRLWESDTKRLENIDSGHKASVSSIAVSHDNLYIAFGGEDGTVHLWDRNTKRVSKFSKQHKGIVHAVAFSPDGRYIASGGEDDFICLWDKEWGGLGRRLPGHKGKVSSVVFSQDREGRYIAAGWEDGTIRLWSRKTGRVKSAFDTHRGGVNSVAFSPDGIHIASGGDDSTVRLWILGSNGGQAKVITKHKGRVNTVTFSHDPEGRYVASGSEDKTIRIWDREINKQLEVFEDQNAIALVAFSKDGRYITSVSADANFNVWKLE